MKTSEEAKKKRMRKVKKNVQKSCVTKCLLNDDPNRLADKNI